MPDYNLAIVGCGHIAVKHAQAIKEISGCRLAAVFNNNSERGKEFADRYGALFYNDYPAMLANPEIDVVCICTPSGLHAMQGIQAARAGKHVLVEKPMALSLADADELINTCKEAGVKLAVVYQNRCKPVIKELRRAIEEGSFGRLSHGNATVRWNRNDDYYAQAPWRGTAGADGGVLLNQAIHNIDLLQWMMGPVESVFAYTATRLRNIETEDVGVGVLKFTSGALGVIEAAATIYPANLEESFNIFGAKGTVVIGGVTASKVETWSFEQSRPMLEEDNKPTGHRDVIEDLLDAIGNDRDPLVDGTEGRKSLALVLALYESASKGLPVKIN